MDTILQATKSIKDVSSCLDAYFEKLSQHLKAKIPAQLEKFKLQNDYLKLTLEQQKEALNKKHKELTSQNTLEVIKKVESMSAMLDMNAPTEKQALVTRFEKTKIDHFNSIARRSAFENSPFKSEFETISKNFDIESMAFQIKAKNNANNPKNSDIALQLSTLRSHLKNLLQIDESLNSLKAKLPKMLMDSPEIIQMGDKISLEITLSGNKILELSEKIINDKK